MYGYSKHFTQKLGGYSGIRDLGKVFVYSFDFLKMFEYFSNTFEYFGITLEYFGDTSEYFEILCGKPMKKMEYQRAFTSG